MEDTKVKKSAGLPLMAAFILLFAIVINPGCKKNVFDTADDQLLKSESLAAHSYLIASKSPELLVWLKPGRTKEDLSRWVDKVKKLAGGAEIASESCQSCDGSLLLLKGPGLTTYIQGNTATGGRSGSPPTPTSGEDGPVYYSRNFEVSYSNPNSKNFSAVKPLPLVIPSTKIVKVAVLDTGVDTFELKRFVFNSINPSCTPNGDAGYNFFSHNRYFGDDNAMKHGSTVTRFVTDQVVKYGKNQVEILPVKTHDKNGISNLFTILCAFAYAKERGVHIINASFGFYLPRLQLSPQYTRDPNVLLLRAFTKYYLTDNKILLVASAGNKDDVNELKTFDEHLLPYPSNLRNLDQVSFYPASLARDPAFPNVLAVTTVDAPSGTVSPFQNFSPDVVDIGVNADAILGTMPPALRYVFYNPRFISSATAEGSSFATPIITGKLAANYELIKAVLNTGSYTRKDIWNAVGSSIVKKANGLEDKTKNGKYVIK
ncbi:MAG: hypothetical protein JWQ40_2805 [Segetibacter sp.]|nr:hypothetical protein [Segetibacter sp.]